MYVFRIALDVAISFYDTIFHYHIQSVIEIDSISDSDVI